uniref:protein-tyrosine phosphatase family protein n=1 Tax=Salmonella sp. s51228 TaxID=3159652 RepID=UPI003980C05B
MFAAVSPDNRNKNRYDDYIPFDSKRVKLDNFQSIPNHNDYINASYADRYQTMNAIIIAQGPLNSTIEDFWKMIIQSRVRVIIMLCDIMENGLEMCTKYWPEIGES